MNNSSFNDLTNLVPEFLETDLQSVLTRELNKSIDVLDLTEWQKEALRSIKINLIKDVLTVTESELRQAYYVGEIRARRVRNAALASVYEYLNG